MSQIENQNGERPATRRRWYWLATGAVLLLYLLVARGTIEAYREVGAGFSWNPQDRIQFYVLLLVPQLSMLCAVTTMIYIVVAKSASLGVKVLWALVLLVALIGWPVSCGTGALLTYHGSWIAH
jgi:uncharacterized membrane protein YhaH (DUF805 family)